MPPEACLVIFTRYPEPGQTKTRLILALGAVGAAQLHRQMAEHTLRQARGVPQLALEIRFTGGTLEAMQAWLGNDLSYQPQGIGDLGDRLTESCQSAFAQGRSPLLIIGTDCPELRSPLLTRGLELLTTHDLVLGPAVDGGYYLIGLKQCWPELFQGIAWSTERVLAQTVAIANSLGLAIAYLPTLRDIDRPEDLAYYDEISENG